MRNLSRDVISLSIAFAISRSLSVRLTWLKKRRHSAMVISVTW
ncbi:MAG: hypothetical protein A4E57_04635 [Syntrophorhabdaceae bacterium PtaU1.Bin034]|nr:MAG: hypothetical protein A4E57_04635 [Syntrophorhabdaceae bacterium PtaU1.Bin034]